MRESKARKDPLQRFRIKEELTSRDYQILSMGIPYWKLYEEQGTIEFKFRAWTGTVDLFQGERVKILDFPVGRLKRLIFERTLDWFCFILVDYNRKLISEARLPHRLFDPFSPFHVFLVWNSNKIGLAIGNVGKNNLKQIWVKIRGGHESKRTW